MIILKTKKEIEILDRANSIVHRVLDKVSGHIKPGVRTIELDEIADQYVRELDATPAFLNYRGFPKSICVSINDEIVHGIPGDRVIQDGDIVSIDFGATYKGFIGDAARTIIVGDVVDEVSKLVKHTKTALDDGIKQVAVGKRLNDISISISLTPKFHRYGNIKLLSGHGIGKDLHERPSVFNYVNPEEPNIRLQEGMVLALEPMLTLGGDDIELMDDGWTVRTKDGSLSAHWEVSVAIVDGKSYVLGIQ